MGYSEMEAIESGKDKEEERIVQCEFFIPIVRNSDRKPHQPISWRLFTDTVRANFPAGHTGPETFYRGDIFLPGEYEGAPGTPPVKDESRRYILAIPESQVDRLRNLLTNAAITFDQESIYLAVAGYVEFIRSAPADGCL